MDIITALTGVIGVVAGGIVAAVTNYFVQGQQFEKERAAEAARWQREDQLRNIDERRQTYTDFLEKMRWMLAKTKDLDAAVKDLTEAPLFMSEKALASHKRTEKEVELGVELPVSPEREQEFAQEAHQELEQVRQRIEAAIDRVAQLQKDLEWDMNGAYTLLTKIEIFGREPTVPEAARDLFAHNRGLLEDKNKIVNEGVELRRAKFAEPGKPFSLEDTVYKQHYAQHYTEKDPDSGLSWAEQLKNRSQWLQDRFNDEVRKELGITSV